MPDKPIDLFRKSLKVDFKVTNGGEKVEPEAKTLSSITVSSGENLEPFDEADGVFHLDPLFGQFLVLFLECLGQRLEFCVPVRRLAVGVNLLDALIG